MFEKTFSFWNRLMGNTVAAPPPDVTNANEDRRLWARFDTDVRGRIQLADQTDSEKIPVTIRDLSVGGANLLVDRLYQPGHMVRLELPGSEEGVRTVLACVVRVNLAGENLWSIGCVFARELSHDDLDTFGAKKEEAKESDLRRWVRFTCAVTAKYRKVGDAAIEAFPAEVLNISANGIGLAVTPPLDTGSLLNLELTDKQGKPVKMILACVVHTTLRASGELAVGCNFIRELSDEELQPLL